MRASLVAMLLLLPLVAFADPPGIEVQHAWSRAMPAGGTGVVYLTIVDHGAPNAVTGVASPVAASAHLHETINDGGVMKMRPVARLDVSSAKPVALMPGGYHIMLMGLKHSLASGSSFPVTLTFAQGGQLTTNVTVESAGATMPGMNQSGMSGMDMRGMSMGGTGSK